jgi:hypothetical protein
VPPFVAGKNKIINGDFGIWQRGTSFTSSGFTADRFGVQSDATFTASRQTFTPGTAPVSGYEGEYFMRMAKSAGGTYIGFTQRTEDVRALAGQTVTLSLWAKADSATTLVRAGSQVFGSGGSTQVNLATASQAITTSWARYSFTYTVPSISGKTIGTSSYIQMNLYILEAGAKTLDVWGVQVESGSVATPFTTATGTIQGELAACQRYYYRIAPGNANAIIGSGQAISTTLAVIQFPLKSTLRISPNAVEYAGNYIGDGVTAILLTSVGVSGAGPNSVAVVATVAAGATQYAVRSSVDGYAADIADPNIKATTPGILPFSLLGQLVRRHLFPAFLHAAAFLPPAGIVLERRPLAVFLGGPVGGALHGNSSLLLNLIINFMGLGYSLPLF